MQVAQGHIQVRVGAFVTNVTPRAYVEAIYQPILYYI